MRDRPREPEHPMVLEGTVVAGEPGYMLRMLTEELLLAGMPVDQIIAMMGHPEYRALYDGARCVGLARARAIVEAAAACPETFVCDVVERPPAAVVPLTIGASDPGRRETDHA